MRRHEGQLGRVEHQHDLLARLEVKVDRPRQTRRHRSEAVRLRFDRLDLPQHRFVRAEVLIGDALVRVVEGHGESQDDEIDLGSASDVGRYRIVHARTAQLVAVVVGDDAAQRRARGNAEEDDVAVAESVGDAGEGMVGVRVADDGDHRRRRAGGLRVQAVAVGDESAGGEFLLVGVEAGYVLVVFGVAGDPAGQARVQIYVGGGGGNGDRCDAEDGQRGAPPRVGKARLDAAEGQVGEQAECAERDAPIDDVKGVTGDRVGSEQREVKNVERVADQPEHVRRRVVDEPAAEAGGARVEHDAGGAEDRQHDVEEKEALHVEQHAGEDQRHADLDVVLQALAQLVEPAAVVACGDGDQATDADFPEARRQQIEGRRRHQGRQREAQQHTEPGQRRQAGRHAQPEARDDEGDEGEGGVELLLDAERPHVDERLQLGVGVEVVDLLPGDDVGEEEDRAQDVLGERTVFLGQEQRMADREHGREHDQQRWKQADDALGVEQRQREAPLGRRLRDVANDQVAGNNEEDVDALVACQPR